MSRTCGICKTSNPHRGFFHPPLRNSSSFSFSLNLPIHSLLSHRVMNDHQPTNNEQDNRFIHAFDFANGAQSSADQHNRSHHDDHNTEKKRQTERATLETSQCISASSSGLTGKDTEAKGNGSSADPSQLVQHVEFTAFKFLAGICALMFLLGKLGFGLLMIIPMMVLCGAAYWIFGAIPPQELGWRLERQQNMKSLYISEGETVEWLNYAVEKIWRSIDQDFFNTVEAMVEDSIRAAASSLIKDVHITELDIGSQPPRIQMIRMFPPIVDEPDESFFGEAAFSFHAHPAAILSEKRGKLAVSPPGVSIGVSIGPMPPFYVRGELTALKGKIRFKVTTGPDIPFVSKLTIAFTSPPTVETAVLPISPHLNIMHIPMLKTMLNEGLRMGFANMVDPKSFTVDIQELVGSAGNDIKALGVAMVEIRGAAADSHLVHMRDLKDSYVTLSLSNQPKNSMSMTRVLTNDKDPRWNETLFVLISNDDVSSDANVDIKVWDADKVKFDDLWGSYSIPVRDIVQCKIDRLGNVTHWCKEERVIHDGWAPIDGNPLNECKMKVNFKLSFHPKYVTPTSSVLTEKPDKREKALVEPNHTSGILSVTIRQAINLEIGDKDQLAEEELKHPYNPGHVVSPYAILYINDSKVYQTRCKLRNPSPHWNATSEHFIRDFHACTLRVSVKSSLDLECDPVIGTKCLILSELFKFHKNSTGETRETKIWVPLGNAIGFGKVLLALRYKPVRITLTRELQSSEVGTLIINSVRLVQLQSPFAQDAANIKATMALNVDPVIRKSLKAKDLEDGAWENKHYYMPLIMRRRTALYIHVVQSGGIVSSVKATGRLWLKETIDDEWQQVQVGLYPYISECSKEANQNEDSWDKCGPLGYVVIRLRVKPGFSPVHSQLRMFNQDMVGADPFHNERLTAKAEAWIESQKQELQGQLQRQEQLSLQRCESSSTASSRSMSEDNDVNNNQSSWEDNDNEAVYIKEMHEEGSIQGIGKYALMRKVSWGADKMKHQIDTIREGFNSEARAGRTVAK
ncbi:hypothetical protein BX666DRAFT_35513 [Dichotomocladium elegans]|nr:hypothetical protein BX666DRAFT_35513 [Dichotomocladium elegans]